MAVVFKETKYCDELNEHLDRIWKLDKEPISVAGKSLWNYLLYIVTPKDRKLLNGIEIDSYSAYKDSSRRYCYVFYDITNVTQVIVACDNTDVDDLILSNQL
jgi:hypothetical protein